MTKIYNIDVIAVDFDGTIGTGGYPDITKLKVLPHCVETLKQLVSNGYKLVLWTCRSDNPENINQRYLEDAVNWFKENEIELSGINECPKEYDPFGEKKHKSPKIYADIYLDDRAWPCTLGEFDWQYVDWFFNKATTEDRKTVFENIKAQREKNENTQKTQTGS